MNVDEIKIIRAVFCGCNTVRTDAVYQYDKGRVLMIEGLDLPASYQVHFSNSPGDPAKPIIGDSSGVRVPDNLLETAEPVYAWIYISDSTAGITVRVIIIPVIDKSKPEDYTPTPEEQTVFDQAVAAINEATEAARSAVETVDEKIQDALTEAKASGEFDGPPGPQGEPGPQGAPGNTPVKGVDYWTAADKSEIVAEAVQETEQDVTQLKSAFQELEAHTDTAEYKQSIADKVAGDFVQDVQVAGASVVQDGVANVPMATVGGNAGAIKLSQYQGLAIANDGSLTFDLPLDYHIKSGVAGKAVIVSLNQHMATFYGLAKAAGSDERNSTLPLGQYTEQAKSAIQTMLSGSVTVSGTTPAINALPGVSYVCGEVSTIDIVTPETGIVDITFVSGATPAVLTVTPPTGQTMKWANGFDPSSLDANTTYEINVKDGCLGVAASWT